MPLEGIRVLSLESRRAKEIETLIVRQGGLAFVAPSVKEKALEDPAPALDFVHRLEAGEFDMVICMTASGITFLRDAVAPGISPDRLGAALRRATIVSRGPKPVGILRTLGVPVQIMIPEPNTWKEIVEVVSPRPERRIAVQEYGRANLEMNAALEHNGATVFPVVLYRWEMPEDVQPLQQAAQSLAAGLFDVVIFTSSIQLDHLLQMARELHLEAGVRAALKTTIIASVGPVMTAALEAEGLRPAIVPKHPKMASLIIATAEQAPRLLMKVEPN
jgi:uroporphyrinogen-III synthase